MFFYLMGSYVSLNYSLSSEFQFIFILSLVLLLLTSFVNQFIYVFLLFAVPVASYGLLYLLLKYRARTILMIPQERHYS